MNLVHFGARALKNQCLLRAGALRDEIVCCPVFVVSALSSRVAVGTRAARLLELYQAGRYVECQVPSA